jgi:iron complex outermembrane receptor protein
MKLLYVILVVFNLFISVCLTAQPIEHTLDPLTVSAGYSPIPGSKTGRNIQVIDGKAFQQFPIHSLDELLRYVPGLEVQSRGPAGSQSDIVVRGGTFQQVLVVLDGMRLNDPNTGHFTAYIPISPAEIDRIEVLKGASSAIYGSEAVGGVIHIITKTFSRTNIAQPAAFSAQSTYGEYGMRSFNQGGYFRKGNTAVSAGMIFNKADGQPVRSGKGYYDNGTISGSISHKAGNWLLVARSAFDTRSFNAQNFYTSFSSDTAREKVETFWHQFQAQYAHKKNVITIGGGLKKLSDKYTYNNVATPNKNFTDLWQALVTWQYMASITSTIVTGIQYQDRQIRSNDRGNHSEQEVAGFATLNQSLGSWRIMPGIRIDNIEGQSTTCIPQVNLAYDAGIVLLRGSIGTTTRQADFTEQFNNYNKAFVAGGSIGNPDLEAETSLSYELGADMFIDKMLKISVSGFRREQKNLVDYVPTPYASMPRKVNLSPSGNYALATNVGKVNTTGFETDLQFDKSFSSSHAIRANAGILFLDSDVKEGTPGFYLSSHAHFLANGSLLYSCHSVNLSVNGLYKRRKPMQANAIQAATSKDYFVMNAKVQGFIYQRSVSLFAEVDNVLDRDYTDLLGAGMPGRWFMGGLQFSLK